MSTELGTSPPTASAAVGAATPERHRASQVRSAARPKTRRDVDELRRRSSPDVPVQPLAVPVRVGLPAGLRCLRAVVLVGLEDACAGRSRRAPHCIAHAGSQPPRDVRHALRAEDKRGHCEEDHDLPRADVGRHDRADGSARSSRRRGERTITRTGASQEARALSPCADSHGTHQAHPARPQRLPELSSTVQQQDEFRRLVARSFAAVSRARRGRLSGPRRAIAAGPRSGSGTSARSACARTRPRGQSSSTSTCASFATPARDLSDVTETGLRPASRYDSSTRAPCPIPTVSGTPASSRPGSSRCSRSIWATRWRRRRVRGADLARHHRRAGR